MPWFGPFAGGGQAVPAGVRDVWHLSSSRAVDRRAPLGMSEEGDEGDRG